MKEFHPGSTSDEFYKGKSPVLLFLLPLLSIKRLNLFCPFFMKLLLQFVLSSKLLFSFNYNLWGRLTDATNPLHTFVSISVLLW